MNPKLETPDPETFVKIEIKYCRDCDKNYVQECGCRTPLERRDEM
jgi:hypothetical protein